MDISATLDILKKVSLFANLSQEALTQIAEVSQSESLKNGQMVFSEGDGADCLYIIISGKIQIEKAFRDQRRKVLAILSENDFFGEMAIITNGFRCASAVVVKPSQLIRIEKTAFIKKLKTDSQLCFEILQQVCSRLEAADTEIENLSFQNLPGRISSKILEIGKQFGEMRHDGTTVVRLELTHAKLAEMVGTNRETVSKYISLFKKEGSIAFESRQLTILSSSKLSSWC
jgi:CRP/FNR family transcriptional regulator